MLEEKPTILGEDYSVRLSLAH